MKTTILIKRYSNRKLYSMSISDYITMAEVLELIAGGAQVLIVDHKTKADLTEYVVAFARAKALGGHKPRAKNKNNTVEVIVAFCPTCNHPLT